MNIEVSNVSDQLIGLFANHIFRAEALKSPVDEALRAEFLEEMRRRSESSASRRAFLVTVPEMRLFGLLGAAFGLVEKIVRINEIAAHAGAGGDIDSFNELMEGGKFLTSIVSELVATANRQLTRESGRVN